MTTYLHAIWLKIREPREQRFVLMTIYAIATFGGVAALVHPPQSLTNEWGTILTYNWGAYLAFGGFAALVSVNPGRWWLERIGLLLLMAGAGMYSSVLGYLAFASEGNRFTQLSFILIAFLLFLYRYRSIRGFRYEPRG